MMKTVSPRLFLASALMLSAAVLGCGGASKPNTQAKDTPTVDAVAEERAKLSAEDRSLVEAQEWCVVQIDERLGSMGPPIKLTIKGQPVFICCKGCQKKAEADSDKTIAKLEELMAKKMQKGGQPKQ